LKVSANVKIAMQCFEIFLEGIYPSLWLRACFGIQTTLKLARNRDPLLTSHF